MNENEFYGILGYFSSPKRRTKLDAEVPPGKENNFEEKYERITGTRLMPNDSNYYILHEGVNKWGVELRIYFIITDNESVPNTVLDLRVSPPPGSGYNSRINKNLFIWPLIEHGFRLGDNQNIEQIRNYVPAEYMDSFENGLNLP